MKSKRRFSLKAVILISLAAFLLGMGVLMLTARLLLGQGGLALTQALVYLDRNFVAEFDREALVDNALDAMVESLGDRWSYYLTAKEVAAHEARNENLYTGAGFTYTRRGGAAEMYVVAVVADGPADKAGLAVDDTVVALWGERFTEDNFDELVGRFRGEAGDEIPMTVRDAQGGERELTLTLELIYSDPVDAEVLEGELGYVQIDNFHRGSAERVREVTDELVAQGVKGLIFDVRNDPGGFVAELTDILDYLLPEGAIFSERSSGGKWEVTQSDEACIDLPMVVIINAHSYSAAEMFAAQLRESAGAGLVGEKTTGKGYYQILHDLSNGGALGVSVGEYATGGGKSLIGEGLTPDILEEDLDAQLERAKELLRREIEGAAGPAAD